jgi:regulator of replication initiation timing
MSVIIEQNLGEILAQINHKLENLQKDVTDIKIELTEAKGERQVLKVEIDNLKQDVNAIKGSQQAKNLDINWYFNYGGRRVFSGSG